MVKSHILDELWHNALCCYIVIYQSIVSLSGFINNMFGNIRYQSFCSTESRFFLKLAWDLLRQLNPLPCTSAKITAFQ